MVQEETFAYIHYSDVFVVVSLYSGVNTVNHYSDAIMDFVSTHDLVDLAAPKHHRIFR